MTKLSAAESCGSRAAKRRALERQRQLYLILDDWRSGYSIRKVDLSSDGFGGSDETPGWKMAARFSGGWELAYTGDQRLPPAIFRVEAQRGLPTYLAAFDSKILAMHPIAPAPAGALPSVLEDHFLVFDVRMRSCLFAHRMQTTGADPIYIPAGGRLFALADGTFDMVHRLNQHPAQQFVMPSYGEEARAWWWLELPDPPFERRHVAAYAVHPDGHIFFSIKKGASAATIFSFDTVKRDEWKRHGGWALPFAGGAHYDRDLDAWVGLSPDPDSIGHLSSCDVVPTDPDAGGDSRCPERKLSKEKLFGDVPTERHVGATLVYTGGRSEYCLVQCVSIEDNGEKSDYEEDDSDDERNGCDLEGEDYCVCRDFQLYVINEEEDGSGDETTDCDDGCKEHEQGVTSGIRRYLLRLTTFALKYDKNGDLTTGSSCRVRYYRVPKGTSVALLSNPVAFLM